MIHPQSKPTLPSSGPYTGQRIALLTQHGKEGGNHSPDFLMPTSQVNSAAGEIVIEQSIRQQSKYSLFHKSVMAT